MQLSDANSFGSFLQERCGLDRSQPVLLGVSGGPDSLCLLDVLHRQGYMVIAAHLDHGMRAESGEDACFVEGEARRRGVDFLSQQVDAIGYASANSLSLEEAGRTLRYRFLFDEARRIGAQAVAVAHTADDQVETVLMHFLRGAGLAGLKGMLPRLLPNPWSAEIPLVRPLLFTWREEVVAYCRDHGLEPVLDRSNLDTRFTRNRFRLEIIPFLEKTAPGMRQAVLRASQVLAGDEEALENAVDKAWGGCLLEQGQGYVVLRRAGLDHLMVGLRRRVLRRAIALLRPGLRDIDFQTVERAVAFLSAPTRSSHLDLAAGLALSLEGEGLWLAAWEADLPRAAWPQVLDVQGERLLDIPGVVRLSSGWRLESGPEVEAASIHEDALENRDPYIAWLDADALKQPLSVRSRRPGDRFHPLGMGGHSLKLSDFMINNKLPRRARAHWPLVCSGAAIAWIPGFQPAHSTRLTPGSQKAVQLRLRRGNGDT